MTDDLRRKKKAKYDRLYRAKHRKRILAAKSEWYFANRANCLKSAAKWQRDNPAKCKLRTRKWRAANRAKKRKIDRVYQNRRWANDPVFRLQRCVGMRIRAALHGVAKSASTSKLLGCTIESFWIYLESKFEEGMTRENYGRVWEVDHILPCALFDLTRKDHQTRCFHFSNLQPLFGVDNRKKGSRTSAARFEGLWK